MFLRIETIREKKLVGKKVVMTFADNQTFGLWSSFMPLVKNIPARLGTHLISMQVYGPHFNFHQLNVRSSFEKWAATEVSGFEAVPEDLHAFILPAGLYAVFLHKGTAQDAPATFSYIFNTWLPQSGYSVDNRPHFEVLGEKYKHNQADSEEEVWLPIRPI